MSNQPKKIAVLGSTGSIGMQTLEVLRLHPDKFEAYALTAGNNADLLVKQAIEFQPDVVVIANEQKYEYVQAALSKYPIKVYAGSDAIDQVAEMDSVDMVLAAMVGYAGLQPTIHAIKANKIVALANKETLVVAGDLIYSLLKENERAAILPVDSEHSAIFQSLVGENPEEVEKLILTASGGPFRTWTLDQLKNVKKEQALKNPNWDMGAKITIDSASMMNKGFEVIEAHWLFGVSLDKIEVLVHPQSVVHSMVQYKDGAIKAQLGVPDMKLPIQYALNYPRRLGNNYPRLDFTQYEGLTFSRPDLNKFRNLALAYEAMNQGGNVPCVLNAANEVVVAAFLHDKLGFLQMSDVIEQTLQKVSFVKKPTYEDYQQTDAESRRVASELI